MREDKSYHGSSDKTGHCWSHVPDRVTFHISTDPYANCSVGHLYQSVVDAVDPSLRLFCESDREASPSYDNILPDKNGRETPSIAVMLFLRGYDNENPTCDADKFRLHRARRILQQPPWRFHHAETVNGSHINALPQNAQDFYFTAPDLPLWALRQVHYGREHIRYVLYTQEDSWPHQVQFYTLLLGFQPELLKDDFCLFTVYANEHYDIQLALKKQSGDFRRLDNVHIQIKVKDIGQLVPLFPNVCRPISDYEWETTDHDGNFIVLDLSKSGPEPTRSKIKPKLSCCSSSSRYNHDDSDFCSLTSSSEDFNMTSNDHHVYANHTPANTATTAGKFVFESTSSDLDIDLPLVPKRKHRHKDADETSLTLTTTSEESGIQLMNSSDDTSSSCFEEDDTLKSCLSNAPKHRGVKLRVRFKEEVQTFQDDSFSLHSSGIDSEDQSDSEMETRFSFIPQDKTPESNQAACKQIEKNMSLNIHTPPSLYKDITPSYNILSQNIPMRTLTENLMLSHSQHCHSALSSKPVSNKTSIDVTEVKRCHYNNFAEGSHNIIKTDKDNNNSNHEITSRNTISSKTMKQSKDDSAVNSSSDKTWESAQPPQPPVRDVNTRLRSVSLSDQRTSNLISVSKQNGQQKFYFEIPPSPSGCPEFKNSGHQNATLKFTLKYDSCVSPGQEQVGFYV